MNVKQKKALITGAGSGIGAAIAIELAKHQVHVIIVSKELSNLKNTEKLIYLNGGTSTLVHLDMNDLPAIDRLGGEIFKKWGRLDFLISNAAILGTLGPLHHQDNSQFFDVINTNLISNHRLIRSMDFLLKTNSHSKAIFLSSSLAKQPKAFWGAYAISKCALEHMIKIWSLENQNKKLSIHILDPGKTKTKMRLSAMPGENQENLQLPETVAKKVTNFLLSSNSSELYI